MLGRIALATWHRVCRDKGKHMMSLSVQCSRLVLYRIDSHGVEGTDALQRRHCSHIFRRLE